jgi:hypothetical protein
MLMPTYRLVVVGSLLSSFLTGTHMPLLHEMIEHGARPRWDVLAATLLLVAMSVAGGWALLRRPTLGR